MSAASQASAPAGGAAQAGSGAQAGAPPAIWVHGLWLVTAFLSAVCGIGGGLFAVPILHYLAGLDLKRAIGTSLVLVLVLSSTGTAVELFHEQSGIDGLVVALLIAGGWIGAKTGFIVSRRVHTLWLKRLFALVLVVSGVRILGLDAYAVQNGNGGSLALPAWEMGIVLLVGFGGGFISPLLGVGGGLIVIPALFLFLPGISYLQARACSTAMTVITAAQAAHLHWRAGNVDRSLVWRFAALTAVSSLLGVLAVHRPGWANVARIAMAMILFLVAARFAWDVARKPWLAGSSRGGRE